MAIMGNLLALVSLAASLGSASSAELETVQVLVVGAGVSGLTSAYELLNAGISGANIAILEQRHQPGGRTINIDVPGFEGKKVEAGGTWIGGTQDRVASLSRELGLTTEGKDFFHTCKLCNVSWSQ
jgi:monoamine oxidase